MWKEKYFKFIFSAYVKHKFQAVLKMIVKTFIQYKKGMKFLIEVSGRWQYNILKLYGESWPKFEQVSEKVLTLGRLKF
jgi:hypothetical protein